MPISPPPVLAADAARQRAQRLKLRRRLMGLIFGVPLFLLACSLYLAFGPKPPPPPPIFHVSPQRAAQAERHIDAVREALTAPPAPTPATTPAAPPAPNPGGAGKDAPSQPVHHARGPQGEDVVTMELTEADINAYLSGSKRLRATLEAKGVHAVSVEMAPPNGLIFHANATLKGLTGNGLVATTLTPDPKTAVSLHVTEARFGRLPPPLVTAAASRIMVQLLGHPSRPLPLSVRAVEVRGTSLILTGVQTKAPPAR